VCEVANKGKCIAVDVLLLYDLCVILAHTARVSLRHPMNPPVYLPALSLHENADSDNVYSQVHWVISIPAMHLTALFGFNIVTVGQSDN